MDLSFLRSERDNLIQAMIRSNLICYGLNQQQIEEITHNLFQDILGILEECDRKDDVEKITIDDEEIEQDVD